MMVSLRTILAFIFIFMMTGCSSKAPDTCCRCTIEGKTVPEWICGDYPNEDIYWAVGKSEPMQERSLTRLVATQKAKEALKKVLEKQNLSQQQVKHSMSYARLREVFDFTKSGGTHYYVLLGVDKSKFDRQGAQE